MIALVIISMSTPVLADVTVQFWQKSANGQLYTNTGNGLGNATINVAGCNGCGGGGAGNPGGSNTQIQYNNTGVFGGISRVTTDGSDIILTGQSPTYTQGKLVYDTDNEALTFYNSDSGISLQIGQEEWIRVRNITGSTIPNGSSVYINGASAGLPTIALAQSNVATTTIGIGLTTEAIANNTIGYVTTMGIVHGLDTSAFAAGATVFISSTVAGGLTATAPSAPNYRYRVGIVAVSSTTVGSIHITPSTATLGNGTANQVFGINNAGTAQEVKSIVSTPGNITIANSANTISVGLNLANANTWSGIQSFTQTIPTADTVYDGFYLNNTTLATVGAQQYSPALHFTGQGWKTTATAGSQPVDFREFAVPVQGTTNPTAYLAWQASINGSAYVNAMAVTSGGQVGIGTVTPAARLEITASSGNQLTLTNNGAFNTTFAVASNGSMTITPSNSTSGVTINSNVQNGTNANNGNFVSIGGNTTTPGNTTARFQLGSSTAISFRNQFGGLANAVLPANDSYANTIIGGSPITAATSGTSAVVANLAVVAPIITTGIGAITNAASLYVNGAPTGGTNNYALLVNGTSLFTGYGIAINTLTTTGNTILLSQSTIRCDATSGAQTDTLPTAAAAFNTSTGAGQIFTVKKIDSSGNTCTLKGNGAETIDGVNTKVLSTQYADYQVQSNGISWDIL